MFCEYCDSYQIAKVVNILSKMLTIPTVSNIKLLCQSYLFSYFILANYYHYSNPYFLVILYIHDSGPLTIDLMKMQCRDCKNCSIKSSITTKETIFYSY